MWAIPVVHAVTAAMSGLSDEAASLTILLSFFSYSFLLFCIKGCDHLIRSACLADLSANPGFIKYLDNSARAASECHLLAGAAIMKNKSVDLTIKSDA